MEGKKKFVIFLLILFLVIVPIVSYRFWIYNSYVISYEDEIQETIEKLKNATTVSIDKKVYNGDYLEYNKLKIPNQFKDYLLNSKSFLGVTYSIPKKSILSFGSSYSEIDNLKALNNVCLDCKEEIDNIIRENNLKTDIDVFNYVKNYKFSKKNFFMSLEKLKQDFIISNYISLYLANSYSKLVYIDGDYNGYMYMREEDSNASHYVHYSVVLEKNNSSYYISFSTNEVYTEQQMCDLISRMVIE